MSGVDPSERTFKLAGGMKEASEIFERKDQRIEAAMSACTGLILIALGDVIDILAEISDRGLR